MNWGWIMYLHKENRELFRDAILLASQNLEVVNKICEEDFYKKDYRNTTLKLISDSVEYEVVKRHYAKLTERVFG